MKKQNKKITKMTANKKYFFGWTNIKWVIKELILTFSNQPSFFSSKRIERAILFSAALTSYMIWFFYHYKLLSPTDMVIVTGPIFFYAGYSMNTTQKEKNKPSSTLIEP
jgi:hypothetical protein